MEWIKTSEKLPEEFISVLFYVPSEAPLPAVMEGYRAGGKYYGRYAEGAIKDTTHWMQLPEPPKEEQ